MFTTKPIKGEQVLCIVHKWEKLSRPHLTSRIISEALKIVDKSVEFMWIREGTLDLSGSVSFPIFPPAFERVLVKIGNIEEILGYLKDCLIGKTTKFSGKLKNVGAVLLDLSDSTEHYSPFQVSQMMCLLMEIDKAMAESEDVDLYFKVVALLPDEIEVYQGISRHTVMVQRSFTL